MDIFNDLAQTYGWTVSLIVLASFGLWRLVQEITPSLIKRWQEAQVDRQEHHQEIEKDQQKVDQLERLAALGSQQFTEEQITQMAAEMQEQLKEANEYIRDLVTNKLDSTLLQIEGIYRQLGPVAAVPDMVQQIRYKIQDLDTKISLLVSLVSEIYEKSYQANEEGPHPTFDREV